LFLDPIPRLRRQDPADATPRIDNITRPAWNDVHMSVHYRLARCWGIVDANVKPIGL